MNKQELTAIVAELLQSMGSSPMVKGGEYKPADPGPEQKPTQFSDGDFVPDITQLDLRAFSVRLEDCAGASAVRITRLDAETGALLRELYCAAVYPLGDANRDGKTDSNDAVAILRNLAGYEVAGFDAALADINGDGKADSNDAVAILRKLAGY